MNFLNFLFQKKEKEVIVKREMPSPDDLIKIYPVNVKIHQTKYCHQYWVDLPNNNLYGTYHDAGYGHNQIGKIILGIVALHSNIDINELEDEKVFNSIALAYCGEVKIHDTIRLDIKVKRSSYGVGVII